MPKVKTSSCSANFQIKPCSENLWRRLLETAILSGPETQHHGNVPMRRSCLQPNYQEFHLASIHAYIHAHIQHARAAVSPNRVQTSSGSLRPNLAHTGLQPIAMELRDRSAQFADRLRFRYRDGRCSQSRQNAPQTTSRSSGLGLGAGPEQEERDEQAEYIDLHTISQPTSRPLVKIVSWEQHKRM